MTDSVFISYVHDDKDIVRQLADELIKKNVNVWLDRDKIQPGQYWEDAIGIAIENGAYFIACYSSSLAKRDQSYMHSELRFAIDRLRQMPRDRVWFIPVMIDETTIPNHRISSFEKLDSIQAIRLHENWKEGIYSIIESMDLTDANLRAVRKLKRDLEGDDVQLLEKIDELLDTFQNCLSATPGISASVFHKSNVIRNSAIAVVEESNQAASEALEELISFVRALIKEEDIFLKYIENATFTNPVRRLGPVINFIAPELMRIIEDLQQPRGLSKVTQKFREIQDTAMIRKALSYLSAVSVEGGSEIDFVKDLCLSPDKRIQEHALRCIGEMGFIAAHLSSSLLEMLEEASDDMKVEILDALSRISDRSPEVVKALIAHSKSESATVRERAADAMGGLLLFSKLSAGSYGTGYFQLAPGDEIVSALFDLLSDESATVRTEALQEIQSADATDLVGNNRIVALLESPDLGIRKSAMQVLNRRGLESKVVIDALLENLKMRDTEILEDTLRILKDLDYMDGTISNAVFELLECDLGTVSDDAFDFLNTACERGHLDALIKH